MLLTRLWINIGNGMIICDETCQLYNRCDCKNLRQRCIFDMGIPLKDEDDDEFLDRATY
jgi:hypothetical protein